MGSENSPSMVGVVIVLEERLSTNGGKTEIRSHRFSPFSLGDTNNRRCLNAWNASKLSKGSKCKDKGSTRL
jgi:hypothetical protein